MGLSLKPMQGKKYKKTGFENENTAYWSAF